MLRMRLVGLSLLVCIVGCSFHNEEFADTLNPCCGQDELLAGEEPSEPRCADLVVSQDVAWVLAGQLGGGSSMSHWRVRLIPGGPACIWYKWPGLEDEDYLMIRAPEDSSDFAAPAPPEATAPADTTDSAPSEPGD
jgi:hypothetical protein